MKDREGGKSHRIHATDATMAGELESLRKEVLKELAPLRTDFMRELGMLRKELVGGNNNGGPRKPFVPYGKGCFLCGKEDHFKRDCPLKGTEADKRTPPVPATQNPSPTQAGNENRSQV